MFPVGWMKTVMLYVLRLFHLFFAEQSIFFFGAVTGFGTVNVLPHMLILLSELTFWLFDYQEDVS